MSLLAPVRPHSVVESLGAQELAVQNLRLVVNMILDLGLVREVVRVLTDGEVVVLDRILGLWLRSGHEVLLEHLAQRLAELVTHDVSVANLLINRWVVDQSAAFGHLLL